MSKAVYWVLEVTIKDGQMDAFKALMADMVEATLANEPDTLVYQWSLGEDAKTCHIIERYKDSAAVMTHMGAFMARFAGRFMEVMTPKAMTVYGNPDETVKSAMKVLGPVYMNPVGGFTRQSVSAQARCS